MLELIERETARPTVEEVLERAARRAERAEMSAVEILDETRAERDEQLQRRSSA